MFDKNIYVSTIIDSYNYGTVLQAAATRDVLEPYGKPLFIDYCREAWTRKGLRDIYLKDKNHPLLLNVVRYSRAEIKSKIVPRFCGKAASFGRRRFICRR